MKTEYYSFRCALDDRFGDLNAARDPRGRIIAPITGAPPPLDVEIAYAKLMDRNSRLGDCILGSGELMVSPRAAAIVSKIRCQEGARFVRTIVLDRKGKDEVGECVTVVFPRFLEVLDEARTTFAPPRIPGGIRPILNPVVSRRAMGSFDLLWAYGVDYVVSDRLKRMLEDAKLTNCRFIPLEVSD
jgi:hypothetical protein